MSDGMEKMRDDAVGLANLQLLCSKGEHCTARLIKRRAGLQIQISVPGKAEAEWPREEDTDRTAASCSGCGKWFPPTRST